MALRHYDGALRKGFARRMRVGLKYVCWALAGVIIAGPASSGGTIRLWIARGKTHLRLSAINSDGEISRGDVL